MKLRAEVQSNSQVKLIIYLIGPYLVGPNVGAGGPCAHNKGRPNKGRPNMVRPNKGRISFLKNRDFEIYINFS